MKLLLDQNLSRRLVGPLRAAFPESDQVIPRALTMGDGAGVFSLAMTRSRADDARLKYP